MERGIDPTRLSVIGLGEFRPIADNASDAGRNMNRRVLIVILSSGAHVDGVDDAEPDTAGTSPSETTAATAAQPVAVTQSTVTPSTVTRSAAVAPAVGPSPL
jgi:chemotaxis protein MotB